MNALNMIICAGLLGKWITKACILSLCCAILSVYSVSVFAATSRITIESIKSDLLNGTKADRTRIASTLGLVIPYETRWGVVAGIPCTDFDSVTSSEVALLPRGHQIVLQVTSSICQYFYLVVLEGTDPGDWKLVKTIPLQSKNGTPHVAFESLVSTEDKEIIVSNREVDTGSGMEQINLMILKLIPPELQVIFDEPQKVVFSIPMGVNGNTEQSEESSFTFIESTNNSGPKTGLKEILQKQIISDHKTQITRWWLYSWNPEIDRFEKTRTLH